MVPRHSKISVSILTQLRNTQPVGLIRPTLNAHQYMACDGNTDTDDRTRVYGELKKHFHPLKLTSSSLYNIINGKVANAVNVQETLKMGESMLLDFRPSLPGGIHAPLKRKVKTMESIKCGVAIGDKTLYDMASLFCCLTTVGQHTTK